jgi:hypothetical protein
VWEMMKLKKFFILAFLFALVLLLFAESLEADCRGASNGEFFFLL